MYIQIPARWQWTIIDTLNVYVGHSIEPILELQEDPTWLAGADEGMGAPITPKVEIRDEAGVVRYWVRGFCQGIIAVDMVPWQANTVYGMAID